MYRFFGLLFTVLVSVVAGMYFLDSTASQLVLTGLHLEMVESNRGPFTIDGFLALSGSRYDQMVVL